MHMDWDESLETGYPDIDEQHKELFRRFDCLRTACTAGKALTELRGLYLFLADYVQSHLALEETLQVKYQYPAYREHKAEHVYFTEKMKMLEDHLHASGPTASLVIDTQMALFSWLVRHILKSDRDLANFLVLEKFTPPQKTGN